MAASPNDPSQPSQSGSADANGTSVREDTTSDSAPAIQELSRLLLSGWTMLAETCPRSGCTMPLARSRSGRVMCTSCGLDVVTAPAASSTTHQPKPEDEQVPNGPSSAVVVPAWRTNNDALSAALGDKLLQGWTMMNEACDDCHVPLVRDARGMVACVGCQRDAAEQEGPARERRGEGEGRELMRTPGVQVATNLEALGGAVTPSLGPGSVARDPSPVRRRGMGVGGMGSDRRREIPRVGGMRSIRALPGIGIEEGGLDNSDEIDVQHELWISELEAGRRLRIVRQRMQGREDLEGIRILAETMREIAKAIRDLRDARRIEYHGKQTVQRKA